MHNHAPRDYDCPFCRLAVGDDTGDYVRQRHVLERTPQTLTFVAPKWWESNPGHVLVVPTDHHENLYDIPDDVGAAVHRAVRRAAVAMRDRLDCHGTSTRQHNEPAGNQDVWHFHVHVFPRYERDGLYSSPSGMVTHERMDEFADAVRPGFRVGDN